MGLVDPTATSDGKGGVAIRRRQREEWRGSLNVVNVDLLLVVVDGVLIGIGVAELEVGLAVLALAEGVGLVDLCVLGQLAVGLEGTGLVGGVLEDDVALAVLEFSQGEEDDVALVDPDLLAHLATNLRDMSAVRRRGVVCLVDSRGAGHRQNTVQGW
jgi:hypothetical protein